MLRKLCLSEPLSCFSLAGVTVRIPLEDHLQEMRSTKRMTVLTVSSTRATSCVKYYGPLRFLWEGEWLRNCCRYSLFVIFLVLILNFPSFSTIGNNECFISNVKDKVDHVRFSNTFFERKLERIQQSKCLSYLRRHTAAADCMSSTYSHRRNGKRTILHDSLTSRSRAVTITPVNMRERDRGNSVYSCRYRPSNRCFTSIAWWVMMAKINFLSYLCQYVNGDWKSYTEDHWQARCVDSSSKRIVSYVHTLQRIVDGGRMDQDGEEHATLPVL